MSRDPLDRYYTDPRLALGCLRWLQPQIHEVSVVLEPCSGGGAFGLAARTLWPDVTVLGCDIDPDANPGYPWDLTPMENWNPTLPPKQTVGIITNPHYVGVYDTVRDMRALQAQTKALWLALLLRETTLGQLMETPDPPHKVAVSPIRPTWGGPGGDLYDGGDNCGSALCLWRAGASSYPTTLHYLPAWRDRRKRNKPKTAKPR